MSLLAGHDAFLECEAGGEPEPRVTWTFERRSLDRERVEEIHGKGLKIRRVRNKALFVA